MSTGLMVLISYFLLGVIILGLLDIATGRLRRNWNRAVVETMTRMSEVGIGLSSRACSLLFLIVMWIFWPMVLFGAAQDVVGDINKDKGAG